MSASSKKKLRSGQASAKLTEKQLAAKKEEQKVRLYTIAFVVVLVVLLVVAVVSGISQKITSSGLRERKTIAMTVGSHEISNAELSYYYIDSVNTFYSQNGAYASLYGLDVTKPLDEQQIGSDGSTWADNFLDSAKSTARAVYTLADDAAANGFTLPAEQESQVDTVVDNMGLYATMYGYNSTEAYLKAMYGNGATVKDFREYYRTNLLADAYQTNYENSLTYTDEQIAATLAEVYRTEGYLLDPHGAVAYRSLLEGLQPDEVGVMLETAHPAKFKSVVDEIIGADIDIPDRLLEFMHNPKRSVKMSPAFGAFKKYLLTQA